MERVGQHRKAFDIIGDWKETANNAVRWCKAVKGGAERCMAEWREEENMKADARSAKEVAEEAKLATHSAVASGVTPTQAFNGSARVLFPPPKHQC